MELKKFDCPACGSNININIEGRKSIFCPFCGSQFCVDTGETVVTHNINLNTNTRNNEYIRINNEADVIRAKAELQRAKSQNGDNSAKYACITIIALSIFLLILLKYFFG